MSARKLQNPYGNEAAMVQSYDFTGRAKLVRSRSWRKGGEFVAHGAVFLPLNEAGTEWVPGFDGYGLEVTVTAGAWRDVESSMAVCSGLTHPYLVLESTRYMHPVRLTELPVLLWTYRVPQGVTAKWPNSDIEITVDLLPPADGPRKTAARLAAPLTKDEVWRSHPGIEASIGRIDESVFLVSEVGGASAYEVWRSRPGNGLKTVDEYLNSLKAEDPLQAQIDTDFALIFKLSLES